MKSATIIGGNAPKAGGDTFKDKLLAIAARDMRARTIDIGRLVLSSTGRKTHDALKTVEFFDRERDVAETALGHEVEASVWANLALSNNLPNPFAGLKGREADRVARHMYDSQKGAIWIDGAYTLMFSDGDETITMQIVMGKTTRIPDVITNRTIETVEPIPQKIDRGGTIVNPSSDTQLFYFLMLHPSNESSVVRKPDAFKAATGWTVTVGETNLMSRDARINDSLGYNPMSEKADKADETTQLVARLNDLGEAELRTLWRNFPNSGFRLDTSNPSKLRGQYLATLLSVANGESGDADRSRLVSLALGDKRHIAEAVKRAIAFKVLKFDGDTVFWEDAQGTEHPWVDVQVPLDAAREWDQCVVNHLMSFPNANRILEIESRSNEVSNLLEDTGSVPVEVKDTVSDYIVKGYIVKGKKGWMIGDTVVASYNQTDAAEKKTLILYAAVIDMGLEKFIAMASNANSPE